MRDVVVRADQSIDVLGLELAALEIAEIWLFQRVFDRDNLEIDIMVERQRRVGLLPHMFERMAHGDLVDGPVRPRPRYGLEIEARIWLAIFVDVAVAGEL